MIEKIQKETNDQEYKIKNVAFVHWGKSREKNSDLEEVIVKLRNTISELGYNCTPIEQRDPNFVEKLMKAKPDFVFNYVPGDYGEDGRLSGFYEVLNIPYTYPGVFHHVLSYNKPIAKLLFKEKGLNVPRGRVVTREEIIKNRKLMDYPYILKQVDSGSSLNLFLIKDQNTVIFDESNCPFLDEAMVEEFIPGDEYTVPVFEGKSIGIIKVDPKKGFYDNEFKFLIPTIIDVNPDISEELKNLIKKSSELAYEAVKGKSVTRVDLKHNPENGKVYILEINTIADMDEEDFVSLCFKENLKKDYPQLVQTLINNGVEYWEKKNKLEIYYRSKGFF